MTRLFVTGISTEVDKTMASAVLVETLEAQYRTPPKIITKMSLHEMKPPKCKGRLKEADQFFSEVSYLCGPNCL